MTHQPIIFYISDLHEMQPRRFGFNSCSLHTQLLRTYRVHTSARTVSDDKERLVLLSGCLALTDEHDFPPVTLQMALLSLLIIMLYSKRSFHHFTFRDC